MVDSHAPTLVFLLSVCLSLYLSTVFLLCTLITQVNLVASQSSCKISGSQKMTYNYVSGVYSSAQVEIGDDESRVRGVVGVCVFSY